MSYPLEFTVKKNELVVECAQVLESCHTQVVSLFKRETNNIISQLRNNTLPSEAYNFSAVLVGLTGKNGLYLLANIRKHKLYIGSTTDLSDRKRTYRSGFNHAHSRKKLPAEIRKEVEDGESSIDDFVFIPVVQISDNSFETKGQAKDFVTEVEDKLLADLDPSEKHLYYNRRGTVFFEPGSNKPKKLRFGAYVWSSERAASNYCSLSRPVIRSYTALGVFVDDSTLLGNWETLPLPDKGTFKAQLIAQICDAVGQFIGVRTATFVPFLPLTIRDGDLSDDVRLGGGMCCYL